MVGKSAFAKSYGKTGGTANAAAGDCNATTPAV